MPHLRATRLVHDVTTRGWTIELVAGAGARAVHVVAADADQPAQRNDRLPNSRSFFVVCGRTIVNHTSDGVLTTPCRPERICTACRTAFTAAVDLVLAHNSTAAMANNRNDRIRQNATATAPAGDWISTSRVRP